MEAPKFSLNKAKNFWTSQSTFQVPLKFINGKLFNFGRFSLFPRKPLKDHQRSHRPFKTCQKNCERHPKDFVGGLRETLKPLNLVKGVFFSVIQQLSNNYLSTCLNCLVLGIYQKMLSEWGLWNNSWVKNLPVRPLAPRRKTPGQLYPAFRPPGQGQKFISLNTIII